MPIGVLARHRFRGKLAVSLVAIALVLAGGVIGVLNARPTLATVNGAS